MAWSNITGTVVTWTDLFIPRIYVTDQNGDIVTDQNGEPMTIQDGNHDLTDWTDIT
jgi:hypothetical protein